MKTYKLEDLEANRKTGMDYVSEHERMLKSLKEQHPRDEEVTLIWPLPRGNAPHWTTDNILNPDGSKMEGSGRVPKAPVDE